MSPFQEQPVFKYFHFSDLLSTMHNLENYDWCQFDSDDSSYSKHFWQILSPIYYTYSSNKWNVGLVRYIHENVFQKLRVFVTYQNLSALNQILNGITYNILIYTSAWLWQWWFYSFLHPQVNFVNYFMTYHT